MIDAALASARSFLTGKLFQSNGKAYGLLLLGISVTAGILVFLVKGVKLGVPIYAAVAIAAFVGGALQPRLYKNLKYR